MARIKIVPPPTSVKTYPPEDGFSGPGAVVHDIGSALVVTLAAKIDGGLSAGAPKKIATGPKVGASRTAVGIGRTSVKNWFPARIVYLTSGEVQVTAGLDVPSGASDAYVWGQVVLPK